MTIPVKHERTELREAIVAQLKGPSNNRTAAGARVTKSRMEPAKHEELPTISVYSAEEENTSAAAATLNVVRAVSIEVVGWVDIPDTAEELDDVLDALDLEIEAAMDLDRHHASTAVTSRCLNTIFGMQLEGKRPLGAVSKTYECTYKTLPRLEDPPDDFDELAASTDLAGEQATADQTSIEITDIHEDP